MTYCKDCKPTNRPQILTLMAFKGGFKPPKCEECGVSLYA